MALAIALSVCSDKEMDRELQSKFAEVIKFVFGLLFIPLDVPAIF